MFPILLLALFRLSSALDDLNCTATTAKGTMLTPYAVVCSDLVPLETCQQLFGGMTPDPAATIGMLVKDRAKGCYTTNSGVVYSEETKQAAISTCPKYCGFCCETPEYNCKNSITPRIDCSQISQKMCDGPLWRDLVAQDCPGACGFCLLGGCIDAAADCAKQPTICSNSALSSFTQANCKRTCGLCQEGENGDGSGSSTISPGFCGDSVSSCALWAAKGFCSNIFYTALQKMQYCGSTCGLC